MLEWFLQARGVADAMGADNYAFIGALAAAAAIIIQALRKRKDVDIAEIIKKNETLDARVTALEQELLQAHFDRFVLRKELAKFGIPDPTLEETA